MKARRTTNSDTESETVIAIRKPRKKKIVKQPKEHESEADTDGSYIAPTLSIEQIRKDVLNGKYSRV